MKQKRRKRLVWIAIAILVIATALFIVFDINIRPIVVSLVGARAKSRATQCINDAVNEIIYEEFAYDEFVDISTDAQGHATIIQANPTAINHIGGQAALLAQKKMEQQNLAYVDIPLGTFLGGQLLSGRGPNIRIRTLPVSTAVARYKSEFTSAGINQTRHRIYLEIVMQIKIVIPTSSEVVTVSNEVLVAETILVGDVPTSYINVEDLNDSKYFVPQWGN